MSAEASTTKLAEMLKAFYAHVNRKDHKPEPLSSNFSLVPSNDNGVVARSERLSGEKLLKVTPSIEEIQRAMAGEWVWGPPEYDDDGNALASTGPLKSIGTLNFSDGSKTEKAYMRGPDGQVIKYDRVLPRGAMLGTTESLTEDAGGSSSSVTIGNSTFCKMMNTSPHEYKPGKVRRGGKSYKPHESAALIAAAIANTKSMPAVTVCPPGVAAGTAQYSDQFIGMKIGSTGKGGAPNWVDIFIALEEQAAERKAYDELTSKDKAVFAAALKAKTLADISPGGSERGARKRGARLLVAANDNYAANLQKFGS